jgi:hypothetical protein
MKKRVVASAVIIVGVLLLLFAFYWTGYLVFHGPVPSFTFNPSGSQSNTTAEGKGTPKLAVENIKGRFAKVSADIRNTGDDDATSVQWSITVKGGILKRIDSRSTGTINTLSKQSITTVQSDRIPLGLGRVEITVTVKASGNVAVTQTAQGFKLLIFLLNVHT